MVKTEFLMPAAIGAGVSWASYHFVSYVASRQQMSTLRTLSLCAIGYLFMSLSLCAFSAAWAENATTKKRVQCVSDTPECYARTHHNHIKACKQVMEKKATFRYIWKENQGKQVFETYLWHDRKNKTIQAFGSQANYINSMDMLLPLQYFCIFNANTGEIIAASFE